MRTPHAALPSLDAILSSFPSLVVGYSGGVDSALVAVAARRVLGRDRLLAAIGMSASIPGAQHEQALSIARQFDLPVVEVSTRELDDPDYIANRPDRCFFCKQELWGKLAAVAGERGYAVVADGTNADDLGEHRPGMAVARAFAIRSPLAEAGLTKADVRREARALGLPIWDAPAAPCLSSRVMYGLSVTPERLRQVEGGEAALRALGVRGDVRVRHRGREARIEIGPAEFDRVRAHRTEIGQTLLGLGFSLVTLDLAGYRRGSLLAAAAGEPAVEVLASRP